MYVQLLIFAIGALCLAGCVHFGLPFWQKKAKTDIVIGQFLNVFACLTSGLVLVSFLINGYLFQEDYTIPAIILGLAFGGAFANLLFSNKPKVLFLLQALLCAVALFIVPNFVSSDIALWQKGLALTVWVAFIYMVRFLDRVPLFTVVTLVSPLLIGCLVSSGFSSYLDSSFHFLFLLLIGYISIVSLILKKYGVYVLGYGFSFFFAFVLGYMGYCLSLQGTALVVPIFVSYDLFEMSFLIVTNLCLLKKLYPIETVTLVERTLAKGLNTPLVVKKLFYVTFFLSLLAFTDLFISHKGALIKGVDNNFVLYICTFILLYNTYLNFSSWGEKRPEFKNLFKDIKQELRKINFNDIKSSLSNRKKDDTIDKK